MSASKPICQSCLFGVDPVIEFGATSPPVVSFDDTTEMCGMNEPGFPKMQTCRWYLERNNPNAGIGESEC